MKKKVIPVILSVMLVIMASLSFTYQTGHAETDSTVQAPPAAVTDDQTADQTNSDTTAKTGDQTAGDTTDQTNSDTTATTDDQTTGDTTDQKNSDTTATTDDQTAGDTTDQTNSDSTKATKNSTQLTSDAIEFKDPNLAEAVHINLQKWENITKEDMLKIEWLDNYATQSKITDLSGLEYAKNLKSLSLTNSSIKDFSPLNNLDQFNSLNLYGSGISNLSAITDLKGLKTLILGSNNITDLSPLSHLTKLENLDVSSNKVTDLSPLSKLTNLDSLMVSDNNVSDISSLKGLTGLMFLDLSKNKLTNIDVLTKLSNLQSVNLENNLLNLNTGSSAQNVIQSLNNKNVIVLDDGIVEFHVTKTTKNSVTVEWNISKKYLSYGNGYFNIFLSLDDQKVKTITSKASGEYTFTGLTEGKAYKVGLYLISGFGQQSHEITKTLNAKAEAVKAVAKAVVKPMISNDSASISYADVNSVQEDGTLEIDLKNYQGDKVSVQLTAGQLKILQAKNIAVKINKGDVTASLPADILGSGEDVSITVEKQKPVDGALSLPYDFKIQTADGLISKFAKPVTLTFQVNPNDVKHPENVKVWYFNPSTKKWELIGGTYANGIVTANTSHFSTYAVFEKSAATSGTVTVSQSKSGTSVQSGNHAAKSAAADPVAKTVSGQSLVQTSSNVSNIMMLGIGIVLLAMALLFVRTIRKRRRA